MDSKYLTKSLFVIGLECPRKLYYHQHPEIYQNESLEDSFLSALAEGGFQVGALAKIYHPEGIDLSEFGPDEAFTKTKDLLKQTKVTIFEATIIYENLLVRIDILEKDGNTIKLLEVKAKSFDSTKDSFFDKRHGNNLIASWHKYLYDVAYQSYVCRKVFPDSTVKPYLYLIDKNSIATVDALNQRFLLVKENGKTKVKITADTDLGNVGEKILIPIDASKAVSMIESNLFNIKKTNKWDLLPFENKISCLSNGLKNDIKLDPRLDSKCRKCEFRCNAIPPLKSGYNECWNSKVSEDELNEPFVFDVWHFLAKSDKIIMAERFLMKDLIESDFEMVEKTKPGLTRQERQWLQVKMARENQNKRHFEKESLTNEMAKWKYPLHFIDFETSRVALPFNAGRKPYEQIAFQFSHHVLYKDGPLGHRGQFLIDKPGIFPNFDFVRELKNQLENDDGTIFRYSNHENSVLCDILKQLHSSREPDKETLIDWIKTITKKDKSWLGSRNMVDLCDLVIKYYYHPLMRNSNSLKYVLPAILNDSFLLQNKYHYPIYGTSEIKSLNFKDWKWIQFDQNNNIIDPYQLLPKLFDAIQSERLNTLFSEDEINQGGAAMTAYAKMQFTEMTPAERENLRLGLLKYCELDTFAMVLLYEYFLELIS